MKTNIEPIVRRDKRIKHTDKFMLPRHKIRVARQRKAIKAFDNFKYETRKNNVDVSKA